MHARLSSRHPLSVPALSARRLTKSFARGLARAATRVTALDVVDLDVHSGEIVALVGGAGSGKTTLLQCLCGLLRADSGAVHSPPETSYVTAVPVFYPFLTPRDVLELSVGRSGRSRPGPHVVEWALSVLDLRRFDRGMIASLPRDALKRIAVAEALVREPRVILFDSNPADSVTPFDAVTLRAVAASAADGAAIVLAVRDASAVASVATRLVLLDRGRIRPAPGRFVAERVH